MSRPVAPRTARAQPTMKNVAALAGVGIKTVSRVINQEPNVAEATAARVWAAVEALDYHVNLQAGSLRRAGGRTLTLGLLVGSVDNPFSGVIHRAVEDLAVDRGVSVFAASLDDDPDREERIVRTFLQRRVDGLIVTTAQRQPAYIGLIRDRGIPLVFIDREPEVRDVDAVTSDNREGARRGVGHLIARGHSTIALLTDRLDLVTAHQRREGFFDAVREAGLSAEAMPAVSELHDADSAYAAAAALLDGQDPPTAIFSGQNLISLGVLRALRERGRERTVAMVGFDDLPLADLLDPGLTVVAQNPHAIGTAAADILFSRLAGDDSSAKREIVETALIPRGSGEISPLIA